MSDLFVVPRRARIQGSQTCVSLNSRLESHKEEEEMDRKGALAWMVASCRTSPWFRVGLVFNAHMLFVPPNQRLDGNKEEREAEHAMNRKGALAWIVSSCRPVLAAKKNFWQDLGKVEDRRVGPSVRVGGSLDGLVVSDLFRFPRGCQLHHTVQFSI